MDRFTMNGYSWRVIFVHPSSPVLVDRTGVRTVATTDPTTKCIYISRRVSGSFLTRVLIHELGHCAIVSYHLTDDIHRMVKPEFWIEAEEWLCNFLMDYGLKIFASAYKLVGNNAITYIPKALERIVS